MVPVVVPCAVAKGERDDALGERRWEEVRLDDDWLRERAEALKSLNVAGLRGRLVGLGAGREEAKRILKSNPFFIPLTREKTHYEQIFKGLCSRYLTLAEIL